MILSLCDYSEIMLEPWKRAGFETRAIDIKRGNDVRLLEYIDRPVHAVFAFPMCTVFANCGARYLWYKHPRRTRELILEGIAIMDACARIILVQKPRIWFMENPVGKMRRFLGKPHMTFNPHQYAGYLEDPILRNEEAYTKRTLLFGEFEKPEFRPVDPVHGSKMHLKYGGASERTKELRSGTPRGFSEAFFLANRRVVELAMGLAA